MVSVEYLKLFNFVDLKLDDAIRKLLSQFCLTGETSERERILWVFSRHYHECNPNLFSAEGKRVNVFGRRKRANNTLFSHVFLFL